MNRTRAALVFSLDLVGQAHAGYYVRPRSATAIPFSYGGVTVYRGANGHIVGMSMPYSSGITIYRGR